MEDEKRRACSMYGAHEKYNILVTKPEGKRSLGRPRRRWEYNIRTDLKKIGWEGVDRIHLAEDTVQCRAHVKTVLNLRVHKRQGI